MDKRAGEQKNDRYLDVPDVSRLQRFIVPATHAIYGFLVATVFCPYISGAAVTPRWILIATIPWLFMNQPPILSMKCAGSLLPFMIWMAMSYLWAAQPQDAIGELVQWSIALGVVLLGATVEKPIPIYAGFAAGIPIAAVFDLYAPNADLIGQAAAVATVALAVSLYELRVRWYWWPTLIVPLTGVFWNGFDPVHHVLTARGALLGLVCAVVASTWRRSLKLFLFSSLAGLLIAVLFIHYGFATSNIERFNIWKDTYAGFTIFGHGIGSFRYVFPDYASHIDIIAGTRPDRAHNDFLDILFELGYVGGALVLWGLTVVLWRCRSYSETLIVVCVLGISATYFPLHIPSTLFMAAFALGRIFRLDALRDTDDKGGIRLHAELSHHGLRGA